MGIRGWLWLPAVSVILTPFGIGWMHYADVLGVLDAQHWDRLQSTVPAPWNEWAGFILLALTAWSTLLVVLHFVLLYLFFTRRTSVPLLFISLHWMTIFYVGLVWAVMVGFHLRAGTDAVRFVLDLLTSIADTAGFTLYFLHSKRVKATFVRPHWRFCAESKILSSPV